MTGEKIQRTQRGTGRRVGDLKVSRERDERMHADYRRHVVKLLLTFAIIGIVIAGVFALYSSPLFSITDIEVSGNHILSSDEVLSLADIPDGQTLLRLDRAKAQENLLSNPWVASASVDWSSPHSVRIVVHERSVAARVQIPMSAQNGSTVIWTIATDGRWLAQLDDGSTDEIDKRIALDATAVPLIENIATTSTPVAGQACSDAGVVNALAVLASLSTDLSSQIVSISAPSAEETMLTLLNGVTVAFGSSTDTQAKERVTLQLLDKHAGAISYVNVRVVDRPAWRGLSSG